MFVSCVWKWEASLVWLFLFYFKTGKLRLGEMKWFYLFIHLAQALESYSSYIWIWAFHLFSESLWKTHLTFSVSSSISKDKYSAMIIIIGIKHYFSRNYRVMANGTCSGTRFLVCNHSHTVRTRISCLVSPGPSSVKWNMPVNICVHVLSLSVRSASLQPHGLYPMRLFCPWGFSKQEYRSGLWFPTPNLGVCTWWNWCQDRKTHYCRAVILNLLISSPNHVFIFVYMALFNHWILSLLRLFSLSLFSFF